MEIELEGSQQILRRRRMGSELSLEVWIGKIVPFFDRNDWNAFSSTRREFYRAMRSIHGVLPPWPKRIKLAMTQPIRRIGLSINQEWLACGSHDGSIAIYHCLTGHHFMGTPHSSPVEHLWFSPYDSNVFVSADSTNEIFMWDLRTNPPRFRGLAGDSGLIPNHFRNGVVQYIKDGNLFVVHKWKPCQTRRALAYSIWSTKECGMCLRHWNERFIHGNVTINAYGNNRWKVTSYNKRNGQLLLRDVQGWPEKHDYRSTSLGTWAPPPQSKELVLKEAINMKCVYPARCGIEFVGIAAQGEQIHSWSKDGDHKAKKELDIPKSWNISKRHFFTAKHYGDVALLGVYPKDGNTAALFSIEGVDVGTVSCDPTISHQGYMIMSRKRLMVWFTDSDTVHFQRIQTTKREKKQENDPAIANIKN